MTQELAKKYIGLGMKPVPVPLGEKAPILKGWPDLKISNDNVALYFSEAQKNNIAVQLGAASGNIVDVDLDHEAAQYFAQHFMPKTEFKYGRLGNQNSHLFYRIAGGECTTQKFSLKEHGCLIEIRGDKSCSLVPGSVHPTGESYEFSAEGLPADVDYAALQKAVTLIAVCITAGLEWPEKGSRHDAALALSGMLCRAGYKRDEVVYATYLVAQYAEDEEAGERRNAAEYTWKKYEAGETVSGYQAMVSNFGEGIAKHVSKWLKQDEKSEIDAIVQQLNERYAVVKQGGKVKVLEEAIDPYTGGCSLKFHDVSAFKQFYLNQTVCVGNGKNGPIYKTYAEVWLKHRLRRAYEAVIFKPSSELVLPDYYNTWQGFAVEPDSSKDCNLFIKHVENVVCAGNKDIAHWVFSWMADAVQNTCEKPGTALVLIGKRGTGKSFFGEYFGSLFHPHRHTVSQSSHVMVCNNAEEGQEMREAVCELNVNQLTACALAKDASLYVRAYAAQKLHQGCVCDAIDFMEQISVLPPMIDVCCVAASKMRDPLGVYTPMLMAEFQDDVDEVENTVEEENGKIIPLYAFDPLHTRCGKQAVKEWMKQTPELRSFSPKQIGKAVFHTESVLCDRELSSPGLDGLKNKGVEVSLRHGGVPLDRHTELLNAVTEHMPSLNNIRTDILAQMQPPQLSLLC